MELLMCGSSTWFLDGTFKTALNIFVQIFTILGLRQRAGRPNEQVALPYVYALLSSKKQALFAEVLRAVRDVVSQYNINSSTRILTAFELGIIKCVSFSAHRVLLLSPGPIVVRPSARSRPTSSVQRSG